MHQHRMFHGETDTLLHFFTFLKKQDALGFVLCQRIILSPQHNQQLTLRHTDAFHERLPGLYVFRKHDNQ